MSSKKILLGLIFLSAIISATIKTPVHVTSSVRESAVKSSDDAGPEETPGDAIQLEMKNGALPLNRTSSLALKYPEFPTRNSSTATIMGVATWIEYDLTIFVNTLRRTGYQGHIIIGVEADINKARQDYLIKQGVMLKFIRSTNCTYDPLKMCFEPYLDVHSRWAKYPLGIDWLRDCSTCTGPVLITDIRDAFFQHDPFGTGTPDVTSLQVYEEHPSMTTENWLVDWPVAECKGVHWKKPMLCSGTTIGTRDAMLTYLEVMYQEMKRWITECGFTFGPGDQSIHNWLFYNGDLKDAVAVKHREGVVHTIGVEGAIILENNTNYHKKKGVKEPHEEPYPGAGDRTWISSKFGLTNEDGEITNLDGSISPVVHQYDRLGLSFDSWMYKKGRFS